MDKDYQILTIDYTKLFAAEQQTAKAEHEKLDRALSEVGVFYLVNHPFLPERMKAFLDVQKKFFDRKTQEKERISVFDNVLFRGYEPPRDQDLKESFMLGIEKKTLNAERFEGPNNWPDFMDQAWKDDVYNLFRDILDFSITFHDSLAMALGLRRDFFRAYYNDPMAALRLLRYPPEKNGFGIAPHKDWGCLSLVYQFDEDGLLVKMPDGSFQLASPPEGAFIVNVGEMVELLTNGRYKAIEHAVINKSGQTRHSLGFFLDCSYGSVLEPIVDQPFKRRVGESLTAGEFITRRHKRDFSNDKI